VGFFIHHPNPEEKLAQKSKEDSLEDRERFKPKQTKQTLGRSTEWQQKPQQQLRKVYDSMMMLGDRLSYPVSLNLTKKTPCQPTL
jgi:hypothetical protein